MILNFWSRWWSRARFGGFVIFGYLVDALFWLFGLIILTGFLLFFGGQFAANDAGDYQIDFQVFSVLAVTILWVYAIIRQFRKIFRRRHLSLTAIFAWYVIHKQEPLPINHRTDKIAGEPSVNITVIFLSSLPVFFPSCGGQSTSRLLLTQTIRTIRIGSPTARYVQITSPAGSVLMKMLARGCFRDDSASNGCGSDTILLCTPRPAT